MARVSFRLVDVFTDRPLAGNQLCVVPDPGALDAATMQALACEIGFSETTFVSAVAGDRYRMRIFTPDTELPFAGHPTLGTAFVLVSEGRVTSPVIQETQAGSVPVEVDLPRHFAQMRQLPPAWDTETRDRAAVAAAAGIAPGDLHDEFLPQVVSTGVRHLIVPARTPEVVAGARPDAGRLEALLNGGRIEALYLFALTGRGAKARMFFFGPGVGEDPATGSAAGPLGVYLALRGAGGMPGRIDIRQGEEAGRPSVLQVEVRRDGDAWQVLVGGGVYIVGEGTFTLG